MVCVREDLLNLHCARAALGKWILLLNLFQEHHLIITSNAALNRFTITRGQLVTGKSHLQGFLVYYVLWREVNMG